MLPDYEAYQAKKAQLLTEIESFIDKLKHLRQTGENKHIVLIARQLETKLQLLSALKKEKKNR